MVSGVRRRGRREVPAAGDAKSPVRPELLKVRSDGQRLSFGVVAADYAYHDLLLREEGEAKLLVGSDRGWVALPAQPGDAVELFIRFRSEATASATKLATFRTRIRCPESGAVVTLAELGAAFEPYHRPL